MKEKRSSQRTPIELAASYGMLDDSNYAQSSSTINISGGGFCIKTDEPYKTGKEIQLSVQLSTKKYVIIDVKVAWCSKDPKGKKYLTGVQIIDASGPDFDKFLDFYCDVLKKESQG